MEERIIKALEDGAELSSLIECSMKSILLCYENEAKRKDILGFYYKKLVTLQFKYDNHSYLKDQIQNLKNFAKENLPKETFEKVYGKN